MILLWSFAFSRSDCIIILIVRRNFFKGLGNQKPELENLVFITSQTNDSIKHHSRRHNRGLNIDQTIFKWAILESGKSAGGT